MGCWSCVHARYAGLSDYGATLLWCASRRIAAQSRCWRFEYEPGSDEPGR